MKDTWIGLAGLLITIGAGDWMLRVMADCRVTTERLRQERRRAGR